VRAQTEFQAAGADESALQMLEAVTSPASREALSQCRPELANLPGGCTPTVSSTPTLLVACCTSSTLLASPSELFASPRKLTRPKALFESSCCVVVRPAVAAEAGGVRRDGAAGARRRSADAAHAAGAAAGHGHRHHAVDDVRRGRRLEQTPEGCRRGYRYVHTPPPLIVDESTPTAPHRL
jgi:hypothetical protein